MIGACPKIMEKTKPTNTAWSIASYDNPAATGPRRTASSPVTPSQA